LKDNKIKYSELNNIMHSLNTKHKRQNYWNFGLCPSSDILKSRKHSVSETRFVSILRWVGGGETRTLLGPLERSNLNHWLGVSTFTWRRKQIQFPKRCAF
jgi:hypothetical protein